MGCSEDQVMHTYLLTINQEKDTRLKKTYKRTLAIVPIRITLTGRTVSLSVVQ